MKITALIENTTKEDLQTEHGLSLYIETEKHKILFDSGQGRLFAENAKKLGKDLSKADIMILSHGHYDHGGGLKTFLELNDHAPVILSSEAFGDYYNARDKYIGLDKSLKDEKRLVFVDADRQIDDELYIYAGCIRKKVEFMGAAGLQMKKMDVMLPDFFDHEIYLMINESGAAGGNGESGSGKKVLISGCSHKGILNIVEWFRPDVLIGGFHFSNMALDDTLKGYAERLNGYDITYYTCHCTGTEQYEFMKKSMSRLNYLSEGMTIEI